MIRAVKTKYELKYFDITSKWGNDSFCCDFDDKLDLWLKQFNEDEKELLIKLLCKYKFYSETIIAKKVKKLYSKAINQIKKDPKDICFTNIEKDYGVGFSDIMFNLFWQKNDIYDSSEKNLCKLIKCGQVPETICIIDDYSGSGDSIIKYLKKLIQITDDIKKKNLYFLVINISETALNQINNFAINEKFKIKIIKLELSKKAFDADNVFSSIDVSVKKNEYSELFDKKKLSLHKFGYGDVQSLISFHYNTPNNTLGIFWNESDEYQSLFKRHKKEKTTLKSMQSQAKRIKEQKGEKPVIFNDIDEKYKSFAIYCFKKGQKLDLEQAKKDLGLTGEQIDERLNYLNINNYFEFKNGKIMPSERMLEGMFVSRIKNYYSEHKKIAFDEQTTADNYIPKNFADIFDGYKKGG